MKVSLSSDNKNPLWLTLLKAPTNTLSFADHKDSPVRMSNRAVLSSSCRESKTWYGVGGGEVGGGGERVPLASKSSPAYCGWDIFCCCCCCCCCCFLFVCFLFVCCCFFKLKSWSDNGDYNNDDGDDDEYGAADDNDEALTMTATKYVQTTTTMRMMRR